MGPHSDTIHTLLWIPQPYPLTLRHSTHLRAIITIHTSPEEDPGWILDPTPNSNRLYDYMMPRLPENQKIKIPQVGRLTKKFQK